MVDVQYIQVLYIILYHSMVVHCYHAFCDILLILRIEFIFANFILHY